jgi:hypothetical protein
MIDHHPLLAGNAAPLRIDAIKNVHLLALENNMSHKKGNTKKFSKETNNVTNKQNHLLAT